VKGSPFAVSLSKDERHYCCTASQGHPRQNNYVFPFSLIPQVTTQLYVWHASRRPFLVIKKYGTPTVWRHSHPRYIVTAAPKILKRRKEEKAMKTAAMMTKVNGWVHGRPATRGSP
jgi:hypothetical protein